MCRVHSYCTIRLSYLNEGSAVRIYNENMTSIFFNGFQGDSGIKLNTNYLRGALKKSGSTDGTSTNNGITRVKRRKRNYFKSDPLPRKYYPGYRSTEDNIHDWNSSRSLPYFATESKNQYDYPDIDYPVPFSELFNNSTYHYVNFGAPNNHFPSFVHFGAVSDSAFKGTDFVFLTGCSSNHVYSTVNELFSFLLADKDASVVLVDFGISEEHLEYLLSQLNEYQSLKEKLLSKGLFYYRKFNFNNFPQWWNISDPSIRGGYSWKVATIFDVLLESKRIVIWSDGGNLLPTDITNDLMRVYTYGAYTPYSGDNLGRWVHSTTSRFLAVHHMVRKIMLGRGMCDGAYMLFDFNNVTVMNNVVIPYVQCAYTRKCISPYGSSRKNHRQDQAVISVLMHSASIKESCHGRYYTQVRTHNDCKLLEKCKSIKNSVLHYIDLVY